MNTGVEEVETAIKLASLGVRRQTYPSTIAAEIVIFENNFHVANDVGGQREHDVEYCSGFGPFLPGFVAAPFGDVQALERAIGTTPARC